MAGRVGWLLVVLVFISCSPLRDRRIERLLLSHGGRDWTRPVLTLELGLGGGSCPVFTDVKATHNGDPMLQESAGGESCNRDTGLCRCAEPAWVLNSLAPASATFELSDLSTTVVAEFQRTGTDKSLRLLTPENSTARVGDLVELEWQPSTDQLIGPFSIDFTGDGFFGTVAQGADVRGIGTKISFVIHDTDEFLPTPMPPASSFSGRLSVFANATASAVRCEGVPSCGSQLSWGMPPPTVPFTISP